MAIGLRLQILFASLYFENQDPGLRIGDKLSNGIEDENGEILPCPLLFYVKARVGKK